eukprot:CAMPEP_0174728952 /NCGR_PEP_ID=MMETSP1094-20130205/52738_1 /TAXON_ID=156173 /ORGANISM="Chrysochromulina brevifilum, Strain UTEX LB 985" /LENGTH=70 /DNA_ID=CAMNT_0015930975 /DNA_START=89 /DNA_END=301 /DNA_ORIENTATION=-
MRSMLPCDDVPGCTYVCSSATASTYKMVCASTWPPRAEQPNRGSSTQASALARGLYQPVAIRMFVANSTL